MPVTEGTAASHLFDPVPCLLLRENLLEQLNGGWTALDSHWITTARLSSFRQLVRGAL